MSAIALSLTIFGIMLVVMALRVPIAIAMFVAGTVGYIMQAGLDPYFSFLNSQAFARFASYDLSVIPLFILMGGFATVAGLSTEIYRLAHAWVGHLRGGLALTTVGTSAIFGAIWGQNKSCSKSYAKTERSGNVMQRGGFFQEVAMA